MKLQLRLKPCLLAGIFSRALPLCIFICLLVNVNISHGQSLFILCLFLYPFLFLCLLFKCIKPYLNRNVPGKTWISIQQTAQLAWMTVGLAMATLFHVRELPEIFCHVPKGSWGMVYRCIMLTTQIFYLSYNASRGCWKTTLFLVCLMGTATKFLDQQLPADPQYFS